MSTVGIVMATYNGEKYVREQIDSILENTYTDWKLWLCDDGSKDGTISILKEYEEKYPEKIIVYQNPKNLGVVLNFLEGAKRCDTDYVMFCDQDDIWMKDKIQRTLEFLKKAEEKEGKGYPVTVFSDVIVVDANLREIYPSFYRVSRLDTKKLDLNHLLIENKLIGCTIMMNSAIKNLLTNLPKSARVHDWWIALVTSGFGKIEYLPKATLLYRQHGNNVIGNQSFLNYVQNRIKNLQKQKQILLDTQRQAYEFFQIYKEQLSQENKKVIYDFATLYRKNWFQRRYIILTRGYLKTGLIRNLGVFLII
ncbi:glycosyl transferase family 2 [Mobilisporobacter senegalensis]|uniref:Glycosyl transferase family 2 n=1 Tax=Mobilisporobacter senegalensis TaxID=1329262 RepID=A0A3N1XLF6_9FIRM|nr:glycosyltransferase family 2 protein [Mobilisporobacter senegalensis]ROR27534.1 glycosyl transferase family 2 [Mobilisporobacter senegalensis]